MERFKTIFSYHCHIIYTMSMKSMPHSKARQLSDQSAGLTTGRSCIRILVGRDFFETFAIWFTPLFMCLSEETLKAVVPFYIVSKDFVKVASMCTISTLSFRLHGSKKEFVISLLMLYSDLITVCSAMRAGLYY